MSALVRRDRFDDFFPDFFRRFAGMPRLAEEMPGEIKIDVTENDKDYQVRAEIPGAKKEDIRVNVDGNFVSISAEVRKEKEEKKGETLRSERYYGTQYRGFTLAQDIDQASADATYESGILSLTLPKKAPRRATEVAVK